MVILVTSALKRGMALKAWGVNCINISLHGTVPCLQGWNEFDVTALISDTQKGHRVFADTLVAHEDDMLFYISEL